MSLTDALGGQVVHCDHCGFSQLRYHSCRNRHCPQCQQHATLQWCNKQLQDVLPVDYFHLVFTLPHELNGWVQLHPEVIYRVLFHASWAILKAFGADKKRLYGELGMTGVLHSWGQNLSQHVHLHCLLPGGAFGQDEEQWHSAKSNYLFRVTRDDVNAILNRLMVKDWCVYSKATRHRAQTVVKYLSRYTHKIAISDERLLGMDDDKVAFRMHDYRDGKDKPLSLPGPEFVRRILLHVLPKGLMRIRHYGFLANRSRQQKLPLIRQCLQQPIPEPCPTPQEHEPGRVSKTCRCPKCHNDTLRVCCEIAPIRLTRRKRH